jgi:hypothetical protein
MENKKIMNETEEGAWAALSPRERFRQSCLLFKQYRQAGGSLTPAPDSQSPFDFPEYYHPGFRRRGEKKFL